MRFWHELDKSASIYDFNIRSGKLQPPQFMSQLRMGLIPLWKTFWVYIVLPLTLLSVATYFALHVWYPLSLIGGLCLGVYGLLTVDGLRYSAARYEGWVLWRRLAQVAAMLLALSSGIVVLGFVGSNVM